MIRAVLWVLVGLVVLAATLVATAPELLADLGSAGGVAALAFGAALPGAGLLLVLAITRKGRHDQPGAGRPTATTHTADTTDTTGRASLTVDDLRRRTADTSETVDDPSPGA